MQDIVITFKKAEVANYNLDTLAFDIRITYDVDGKERQNIIHVTKDDKDAFELAENLILATRKLEKNNSAQELDSEDPLANFVNIKVMNEDDVPEHIARFIAKVMNHGRMNANTNAIPRYQVRDQLCKLSVNL